MHPDLQAHTHAGIPADVPADTSADAIADAPAGAPAYDVPPGFAPYEVRGPYFNAIGPLFTRPDDAGGVVLAVRVAEKHLNLGGVTHGGMLLTLADGAMSANLAIARVPRQRNVTVSLSSEFLEGARAGDWLEAHVSMRKIGGRLAFVDCTLTVGQRTILHASGVFAAIGPPSAQAQSDG